MGLYGHGPALRRGLGLSHVDSGPGGLDAVVSRPDQISFEFGEQGVALVALAVAIRACLCGEPIYSATPSRRGNSLKAVALAVAPYSKSKLQGRRGLQRVRFAAAKDRRSADSLADG